MAETVKNLVNWLARIPDTAEIGIDQGGLTLYVADDPTKSHEARCVQRFSPAGECTCWKNEYYELGGLPEGDDR